ncbi:MAG: hypothetical protein PHZ00_03170 [Candidatus Peribacteraceae bacterium]|nr:hypothetical protein [Candidatus Peribacteraceae bacterium]
MTCCSASSSSTCPSRLAVWFPRIAFGLVLVGYGVNHYRNLSGFTDFAKLPFVAIPLIAAVVAALAYVVPLLMIVGGVLFAIKQLCPVSKFCILAALSGIIGWAGLAILLSTDPNSIGNLGLAIQNAAVLMILYFVIRKMTKCSSGVASCCSPQSVH